MPPIQTVRRQRRRAAPNQAEIERAGRAAKKLGPDHFVRIKDGAIEIKREAAPDDKPPVRDFTL